MYRKFNTDVAETYKPKCDTDSTGTAFMVPYNENPTAQQNQISEKPLNFNHGTTTVGFRFQHGIIVAVDSRATAGQWIDWTNIKKVIELSPTMIGTMAGGSADVLYFMRTIQREIRIHRLRNKEEMSVAAASKWLTNFIYGFKHMGINVGIMICGWDRKGPGVYYVDSDGLRMPNNLFSVGSGASYALGILDHAYRWDLTVDEAKELGKKAIHHATFRDAFSGGNVMVYHVTSDGYTASLEDLHSLPPI